MLSLLKIKNVALIGQMELEFGPGLNLLTGETGSGKSIIVDSLGALTGDRVSSDLIKQGEAAARIEGLFLTNAQPKIISLLEESGIDADSGELIVRREITTEGKNRVFINNQLATQGLLKRLGPLLADIHGQGEHTALYDVENHLSILDDFANVEALKRPVAEAYREWLATRSELAALEKDESEKLQLLDILRFQVDEIKKAALTAGEDAELEEERLRLNNVEKLSALSRDAHSLLYDDEKSTLSTLDRATRIIGELAEYDARFRGFEEQLSDAAAVVSELGTAARDFGSSLDFSPGRLDEIETRLAEISRLKRKYGETIDAVLEHFRKSTERIESIETADFREGELKKILAKNEAEYEKRAAALHNARQKAADKFASQVERDLNSVAMEKAKFKVVIEKTNTFSANGTDKIEFYFSANPGEPPRPLAKTASGGEASRLMLILKTASKSNDNGKTAVFDEIDIGIGGRVAEAVGRKLKLLSADTQVFCVTHQPQIASMADHHFVVEKKIAGKQTSVAVRELDPAAKVEEIARMLAGEHITEQARENARAMLASAG